MKKHIALLFLSLGFFTACDMVNGLSLIHI